MKKSMKVGVLAAVVAVVLLVTADLGMALARRGGVERVDQVTFDMGTVNTWKGSISAIVTLTSYNFDTNGWDVIRIRVQGTSTAAGHRIEIYYQGCEADPGTIFYFIDNPPGPTFPGAVSITWYDYPPEWWYQPMYETNCHDYGTWWETTGPGAFLIQFDLQPILINNQVGGDLEDGRYWWYFIIGIPLDGAGVVLGVEVQ